MTKIVGAFLGVAMTIGVGMGVAFSDKKANPVVAANGDVLQTANFTSGSNPTGWTVNGNGYYSGNGLKFTATSHYVISPSVAASNLKDIKVGVKAGYNGNSGSILTISALDADNNVLSGGTVSGTIVPSQTYTTAVNNITEQFVELSTSDTIAKIKVAMTSKTSNLGIKVISIYDNSSTGIPNPTITFSKDEIDGEEGQEFSFTWTQKDLEDPITWSPASDATEIINYTVDSTNKTVNGTMLKAGSVTLTATSGSASDSIDINVSEHFVHRKFSITSKTSVSAQGDTITGSSASYSQTYTTTAGQATKDNSMTLKITGLTKKVSINKLVLSMHSNASTGAGSASVKIDGGEESFIAGTSSSSGVAFSAFGDSTAFGTDFKNVTWKDLTFVAKSSIEIKIYCTANSLYCQSFDIFFEETENVDLVSALSVSPASWTGYETNLLEIETFTVSVTTNGEEGAIADYTFLGIGYMDGDNFVARDANFTYGYPTTADTRLAWKANYPQTAGGSDYLYAYVTLNVSADTISSIEISGNMTKTTYFTNDEWMYYGLTAEAVYASTNRINVTGFATYQYYSDSAMTNEVATPEALGAGENQKLYVKATYEGVSNTVGYEQTVSLSVEHGSLITDPLTVDEAVDMGKDLQYTTTKEYYICGIVSEVKTITASDATFFLANTTEYRFEAFKIDFDANCTNHDDLVVGAEVLIKCQIRRYTDKDTKEVIIENGNDNGVLLSISFTKPTLESITLNKTKLYLAVNDTYNLKASAYPLGADLDTVVWSTLNNSVATVDQNGVVTAVGLGSATITATSGEITSTCNVVVSEKAVMQYTTNETKNMTATGNAATVGLDASIFSVDSDKGDNSNFAGLNADGTIRLYKSNGAGGTSFTVSIDSAYAIEAVVISYKSGAGNASVYAGSRTVAGNDGLYVINNKSFKVQNTGSPDQVQIESIGIFYRDANAQDYVERLNTQTSLAYRYEKDGEGNFTYSDIVMRFGGQVSKDLWNELDTNEHKITGFGVILMDGGLVTTTDEMDYAIANDMVSSTVSEDIGKNMAIDYFVPVESMNEKIGSDDSNYFWNLRVSVDASEMSKYYSAVAYIKVGDEYVLLNMSRESVESVALDYLTSRGCDETTAGGSLQNIIDKAA